MNTEVGNLSRIQLVQYLSDGWTMKEISAEENIGIRTLEERLKKLRKESHAVNTIHLVSIYLRKAIIK